MTSWIPLIALIIVFILIILRKVGSFKVKIWQAMALGALLVLLTGQISPVDALYSVNIDVMLFLFGMFVVGESMQRSGYLNSLSYRLFRRAKSVNHLILLILFPIGLLSAILMNDTLAIIGTPVVLSISRKQNISSKLLLMTLAIAVTTGSVLSPIGNPQNLLIANSEPLTNPFISFLQYLLIPSLICLALAFIVLKIFFRKEFYKQIEPNNNDESNSDHQLIILSKTALAILVILILVKINLALFWPVLELQLALIAIIAAVPIIVISRQRIQILKNIDWSTLLFFVSMFILMSSVWQSGVFQELIVNLTLDVTSIPVILVLGTLLSQLISNVPLVALYLPLLTVSGASIPQLMALAAGSTIAGNMLILGAASNVIIIQNAEKQGATLTFFEFAKVGIPLIILQMMVYLLFLGFMF
ncbi:MAG: anion transporter [Candidatus Thorarchaeota archaeon]|nr:anion transporter [Candidatus Thorarchaeota archaeon]